MYQLFACNEECPKKDPPSVHILTDRGLAGAIEFCIRANFLHFNEQMRVITELRNVAIIREFRNYRQVRRLHWWLAHESQFELQFHQFSLLRSSRSLTAKDVAQVAKGIRQN
jgi:hypothetical protein